MKRVGRLDPGSLSSRYLLRRYASLRRRLRMPAPRYLLRRYPSLVVRDATRSRDSTHLSQHAQLVEVVPAFHYLAFIREAEDAYPAHSNWFASGSDPPELALMGAASPPAGHHHVSFGYLILDGGTKVREGLAKLPDNPLDVLGPTLLGTTVCLVRDVPIKDLVCQVQVALVGDLLDVTPKDSFILFGHRSFLLPPLSPAGSGSTELYCGVKGSSAHEPNALFCLLEGMEVRTFSTPPSQVLEAAELVPAPRGARQPSTVAGSSA